MILKPHTKVGTYTLLHQIGRGTSANVWAAISESEQKVALKIFGGLKHLQSVSDNLFKREFDKTHLFDNRHIVSVYNLFIHEGMPVIEMELCDNCLDKDFKERKFQAIQKESDTTALFTESELLEIFSQIAVALDFLHKKDIVHNDIKPANIVFTALDGQRRLYKLTDFGISHDIKSYVVNDHEKENESFDKSIAASNTVAYSSPEKIKGINTEKKSDIFSLGVVMYELAGGRTSGIPVSQIVAQGSMINWPKRKLSSEYKNLVEQCLNLDPAKRPTAEDIHEKAESMRRKSKLKRWCDHITVIKEKFI